MKRLLLLSLLLVFSINLFSQGNEDSLEYAAKNSFAPQLIYFTVCGDHEYIGFGFEGRYTRKLTNGVYLNAFYDYIAFSPFTAQLYGVPFYVNEQTTSNTNKIALGFLFKLKASKKAYALVSTNLFGSHTKFGSGYEESFIGFNFSLGEEFFFSKKLSLISLASMDVTFPSQTYRASKGRFLLNLGLNFHF